MNAPRYDAMVIGAGMSGLAAAVRLAQFDKRVVVLERHYLWGGLNSWYKRGGRRYDSGLHALTNFVPRHVKAAPLPRLLRQLRIGWDELELGEQTHSEVRFPDLCLRFSNQLGLFEEDVAAAFPRERDGFARLIAAVRAADPFDESAPPLLARAELGRFLSDPLLVDALMLPVCWYGSAREDDVDWYQFVILFRSLFCEGFARPRGGIKTVLDVLLRRLRETGGELRTKSGVARILRDPCGAARGVVLDDGSEILSDCVLSSAGWPETMALAGETVPPAERGHLSFVESVHVLDRRCDALGHDATITFFNTTDRFRWRRPDALVDVESGVLCCTDNYACDPPMKEGLVRVTTLADHDRWCALDEEAYDAAKVETCDRILDAMVPFGLDPRPHRVDGDMFTPRTIRQFTGRLGGAVYGSPRKRRDGSTGIPNLHLIGTDQGLVGVVGALLSGVTMVNRHALSTASATRSV